MTNAERASAIVDRTVDDLASMSMDQAAAFLEQELDAACAEAVREEREACLQLAKEITGDPELCAAIRARGEG